jgi:hypothetical protein
LAWLPRWEVGGMVPLDSVMRVRCDRLPGLYSTAFHRPRHHHANRDRRQFTYGY